MKDKRLLALVIKAQSGDTEAFEELYSQHAQSILYHVQNLLYDKERYTDVAQDVALRLYEQIGSLKEPLAFRGWMHKIIRNMCTDCNRAYIKQRKRLDQEDNEEYLLQVADESLDADPAAAWDHKLEGNLVYEAVRQLPENYREPLMLRYYDELSYKEIAEALGVSVDNVKVRLHRGTEAARKKMSELGAKQKSEAEVLIQQGELDQQRAFTEGDVATKNALTGAVAVLVPSEVVSQYVQDVNVKLAAVQPVAVAATVASAAGVGRRWIWAIVCSAVAGVVIASVAIGAWWHNSSNAQSGPSDSEQSAAHQTYDYEGSAHIVFTDEEGGETPNGVVHVSVLEEGEESESITYVVSNEQGDQVFSGEGAELSTADLTALEPGMYKVSFTLTDSRGASLIVARSFRIM